MPQIPGAVMAEDTVEGLRAQLTAAQDELAAAKLRIKDLNEESKGHRLNAQAARTELDTARAEMERATKEAADKVAEAEKAQKEAGEKVTGALRDAGLRVAAKDAGMVDLDGLKLLDVSGVKVDEHGKLVLPEKFFETAKTAKPYLFKTTGADTGNTSSTASAPGASDPGAKQAKDMNADELRALESQLGITSRR